MYGACRSVRYMDRPDEVLQEWEERPGSDHKKPLSERRRAIFSCSMKTRSDRAKASRQQSERTDIITLSRLERQ